MAKPNLFKSTFRGKLGDIVGSEWKGVEYWRTYAKPKQPKTPAQLLHYDNFRRMITIANALHKTWFPYIFSEIPGKTLSNQFMTLNKGIYATNGLTYFPKFPYETTGVFLALNGGIYNADEIAGNLQYRENPPPDPWKFLMVSAYSATKSLFAYQIKKQGQSSYFQFQFPAVFTGDVVYVQFHVITTTQVYLPNTWVSENYPQNFRRLE